MGQHEVNAHSEKARLRSAAGRGATAWLRAIPTSYHVQLPNLEMRVALQFWLGTVIPLLCVVPPACDCHHMAGRGPLGGPGLADLRGRHDTSGPKLKRHNAILRALRAAMNMLDVRSSFDAVLAIARGTADNDTQQQPDLAVYDYQAQRRVSSG